MKFIEIKFCMFLNYYNNDYNIVEREKKFLIHKLRQLL